MTSQAAAKGGFQSNSPQAKQPREKFRTAMSASNGLTSLERIFADQAKFGNPTGRASGIRVWADGREFSNQKVWLRRLYSIRTLSPETPALK
jgi:hypothetical protein